VLKGAISQEQADAKFNAWLSEKDTKIEGKKDQLATAKADARKSALAAETAKNQARIDSIKAREVAALAAAAPAVEEVETPAAEVEETTSAEALEVETTSADAPEVEAAVVEETPVAEETAPEVETPEVEAVVVEETPAAEETSVVEAAAEEAPAADDAPAADAVDGSAE
jgi:small subunit ribosomal protein S16